MFLSLISPKNVFHGERIPGLHEITLVGLIAFICVFANINLQEVKHRQRCSFFNFFFLFENSLLVLMWMIGIWIDKRKKNCHMPPIWIFHSFLNVESMRRWPIIHDPDYDLWFQYYQCVIIFCITFFILPAKSFLSLQLNSSFLTRNTFLLANISIYSDQDRKQANVCHWMTVRLHVNSAYWKFLAC